MGVYREFSLWKDTALRSVLRPYMHTGARWELQNTALANVCLRTSRAEEPKDFVRKFLCTLGGSFV